MPHSSPTTPNSYSHPHDYPLRPLPHQYTPTYKPCPSSTLPTTPSPLQPLANTPHQHSPVYTRRHDPQLTAHNCTLKTPCALTTGSSSVCEPQASRPNSIYSIAHKRRVNGRSFEQVKDMEYTVGDDTHKYCAADLLYDLKHGHLQYACVGYEVKVP